jgi:hypothetical protein
VLSKEEISRMKREKYARRAKIRRETWLKAVSKNPEFATCKKLKRPTIINVLI